MNRLMWFLLFLGVLMYATPFALGQQHEERHGVGHEYWHHQFYHLKRPDAPGWFRNAPDVFAALLSLNLGFALVGVVLVVAIPVVALMSLAWRIFNRLLKTDRLPGQVCGFFDEPVRPAARLMGTSRLRPLAGRDADSQRLASLGTHK